MIVYQDEWYPVYTLSAEGINHMPDAFVERYRQVMTDFGEMQSVLSALYHHHRNRYIHCDCWRCSRKALPDPEPLPYEEFIDIEWRLSGA